MLSPRSFRASIAIEGDTLLAGDPARRLDDSFSDDGALFTFAERGGAWSQQPTYLPTTAKGRFGCAVLMRDGLQITSAWREVADIGAVYSN